MEIAASGAFLLPLLLLTYYLAVFLTLFLCKQLNTLQAVTCTNALVIHPQTAIAFLVRTYAGS